MARFAVFVLRLVPKTNLIEHFSIISVLFGDNTRITFNEVPMKKKKRKVAKLTETDYNNYIMSLKEETPPKVIIPEKDK